MIKGIFSSFYDPEVEALELPPKLRALVYYIKKHGKNGASTLDLHAEHFGNISRDIAQLISAGVLIKTEKRDIIDKRGFKRKRVAHRVFLGIDPMYIGV